jgi:hypothetical protein
VLKSEAMNRKMIGIAAALIVASGAVLAAQTPVQPIVESYYRLAPGKADEWLALFKKWHLPILLEQRKQGRILSITIYQPQLHMGGPQTWDYKVTLRYASFAMMGDSAYTEEVTKRLYPNREELRQGEQRRWEITAQHWDDFLVEASEQP